jgi:predicted DsbA family dithiol-disulfide isomerase
MLAPVTIDIISDVICPWCFLGKRRLDKAVTGLDQTEVDIRWRPFLLDATIPKEGLDRRDYLTRKFGAARLATLHDPLTAAGDAEGIPYAFDKIARTPNTLDAHRLLRWAKDAGCQHAMAERLFKLYWVEGADIGDTKVLLQAAIAEGMNGPIISDLLQSEADLDAVIEEINAAAELGINSVPTFIVGSRYAVVGAQPPEVLKSAIVRAGLDQRSHTAPPPLA